MGREPAGNGGTAMKKYIMALDQGTTSSRCILFDKKGNICCLRQTDIRKAGADRNVGN